MRHLIGAMTIALGMGLSGMASAQNGITGSSHDFTDGLKGRSGNSGAGVAVSEDWNGRKEICRVCHVPHDHGDAKLRYKAGLLWNHDLSTATYTMYDSTWSNTITGSQASAPDGSSKLCLSCHDGTVAIDTFDKYAGGTNADGTAKPGNSVWFDGSATGYSTGYKVPGVPNDGSNLDLRGTHPISIAFPTGQVGTEFNDPAGVSWIGGETVASTLDKNNRMQCSTCHDVHSQNIALGSHLLRKAQTVAQGGVASGLCLTCHIK